MYHGIYMTIHSTSKNTIVVRVMLPFIVFACVTHFPCVCQFVPLIVYPVHPLSLCVFKSCVNFEVFVSVS